MQELAERLLARLQLLQLSVQMRNAGSAGQRLDETPQQLGVYGDVLRGSYNKREL